MYKKHCFNSPKMAPLNPLAADYFPHHHPHHQTKLHNHHHHQIIMLHPCHPTSQHYRPFFSTQHSVYYYPPHTTTAPPFSHPSSFQTHQLTTHVSPPQLPCPPRPVRFLNKQRVQEHGPSVVENNNNRKQAFLHRRSDRSRQPRYAWKIKGRKEEEDQHQKMRRRRWIVPPRNEKCCSLTRVRPDQTTVMIKNIPSKYTRDMLIEFLDNHCMRENGRCNETGSGNLMVAFDFVYLPVDFKTGFNKGYAFVNFTNSEAALKFSQATSHQKWDLFQSKKIRVVVAARLQGKEILEKHFGVMRFPCQSEEYLPVFFNPPRDGTLKGEQRTVGRLIV